MIHSPSFFHSPLFSPFSFLHAHRSDPFPQSFSSSFPLISPNSIGKRGCATQDGHHFRSPSFPSPPLVPLYFSFVSLLFFLSSQQSRSIYRKSMPGLNPFSSLRLCTSSPSSVSSLLPLLRLLQTAHDDHEE